MVTRLLLMVFIGLAAFSLCGCKPADPPPDLLKPQRDTLNQAKQVEGQLQQQAQDQAKAIEDGQK